MKEAFDPSIGVLAIVITVVVIAVYLLFFDDSGRWP